ncbi:unnamed protein product, partial [Ectocarpus fasciculatus]
VFWPFFTGPSAYVYCTPDVSPGVTLEKRHTGAVITFLFVLLPHLSPCDACLGFYVEKGSGGYYVEVASVVCCGCPSFCSDFLDSCFTDKLTHVCKSCVSSSTSSKSLLFAFYFSKQGHLFTVYLRWYLQNVLWRIYLD